jgi:ABC-2 type transport system permease protein
MAVVVLVASSLSLKVVVEGFLAVDVPGSVLLFGVATLLYLFAAASIGIFMGTLARNMPQFGLMSILVLLPLQILSGALTPRESMPELVRVLMSFTPPPITSAWPRRCCSGTPASRWCGPSS